MNSVIQKVHSLVMFLIIAGMVWIGFFQKDELQTGQDEIISEHKDLDEGYNSTLEVYDRLEKKWIGTSKHVRTLQNETKAHYDAYNAKMESISDDFERVELRIEQLEETIMQKLDRLSDEISVLSDEFSTNKRNQNRTNRENKMDIKTLKDQFESLDRQLNPKKYAEEDKK